jgi:hypothetical protein
MFRRARLKSPGHLRNVIDGEVQHRLAGNLQQATEFCGNGLFTEHGAEPTLPFNSISSTTNAMSSTSDILLIERIERVLILLAYFIQLDGDAHVAMHEKFESELDELRRREGTKERARRLLASYSRSGDVKAIPSKTLNLSAKDGPLPYLGL